MVDAPKQPYTGDEMMDNLIRMNTELMSELWVLRDRVTILEHMLQEKGTISRKALDDFVPTGELAKELVRERDGLVEKVVGGAWMQGFSVESLVAKAKK
ncbi:MAG: hypothetical protein EXR10_11190 [Alphaproteobacteria bacterium]|nr:hypothetical protein [Alphaproteobacteria bacterium]PHY00382.1 MAG: hypothetical protein CK529_05255 [Rhodospirillaceae bacterium]